jgi:penicillin-binding protein 1A
MTTIAARRKRRRQLGTLGRVVSTLLTLAFLIALFAVGTFAGIVYAYSRNLPDISKMADFQPSRTTRVYARDGSLLASLYTENRIWVPIAKIPPIVRDAFVATEDRTFYTHHGVDFYGMARAALADYQHQRFQGASTITQQLARALFLSNEVSVSRKIQEALLAMEIERYYTKSEILERYLNLIYFGAGAYGIEAASHTYFGTDVGRLTIAQAAMLAGLPAAPSDYSPYVNLQRAKDRQGHVLARMAAAGYITPAQKREAENAPLRLIGERPTGLQSYRYPYFTTYVNHVLNTTFGTKAVFEGGLEVNTTLDPHLQDLAQEAVRWGVNRAVSEGIGAHEAALVAIRPTTGEIVAMVGGAGFRLDNQFNRAWQAMRQPGSSFKVFVYTAAVDSGMPATAIVDDAPVSYPNGDGTAWRPTDDDGRYFGPITLRYALAQSRNVVAVKLAEQLGIDRVITYAHRMGVTAPLDPNLSLALGSSVVSPLDMASGYATLADEGVHVDPTAIRLVKDTYGATILDDRFPQETEVVSAGTAYVMSSMLQSVINEGTGYPNAQIGRPAAGKTGTTSDYRDAWFVGYTPDLVAAVWLGNDDYTRMNESYGGNIPARTWARFMRAALVNVAKHDFAVPSTEVHKVALCGSSKRSEYYVAGTEPSSGCAYGTGAAEYSATAAPAPAAAVPVATAAPVAAVRPEPPARRAKPAAAPPPAAERAKITTVEFGTPEPASAEKGGH